MAEYIESTTLIKVAEAHIHNLIEETRVTASPDKAIYLSGEINANYDFIADIRKIEKLMKGECDHIECRKGS